MPRLEAAAQLIEMTEERSSEVERIDFEAIMVNARGNQAAAEQNYHRALVVAKRQSAKTPRAARCDQPRPPVAQPDECTEAHDLLVLRMAVHRRLRHASPEGRQAAAQPAGMTVPPCASRESCYLLHIPRLQRARGSAGRRGRSSIDVGGQARGRES